MGSFARTISLYIIALCLSASLAAAQGPAKSQSQNSGPSAHKTDLPPIQVFFGPRAADDPTGVFYNFMKFLDTAKSSIYGSAHEVDMVVVAQKLAAKAEAGVDVEIVIESRWLNAPKDRAAINILKKSKVKLIPDVKKSGLMHNKFFVIDKERVWTGSTNITEHCLLFNYNNGVWVENKQIVENYLTEFEEEREGRFGKKGSGANNTPYPVISIGSTRVATFFSPEDTPVPSIVDMINGAKKSIDVMCFVFSSQEIGEAIAAAHKRGVKVRVLLDNSFSSPSAISHWRYVPFKELKAVGVACKYDNEEAKLHHKVVIVDGNQVMTGSFNLSNNAAKSNDENLMIIGSAEIASKYEAEFEKLWNLFNGDPGTLSSGNADLDNVFESGQENTVEESN